MGSYDPPQAAAAPAATGFMLLTINNCKLISSTGDPSDRSGTLEVICVTLADDKRAQERRRASPPHSPTSRTPSPERDVWIVLRIDGYEIPVAPTQTIMQSRAKGTYTIVNNPGEKPKSLTIVVPSITTGAPNLAEDLETLEVLLSQYGILQVIDRDEYGSDGDLKGRLVLVDQSDGEYVGWLGGDIDVTEDPSVVQGSKEPVVVEISEDGQKLNVHSVGPDDQDMLLKSAGMISRGIIYFGDTVASGFNKASSMYISRTAPNPEPIQFSETTRMNVKRVHTFSGKAVTVTAKTTGLIHNLIDHLANKVGSRSDKGNEEPPPPPDPNAPPPKRKLLNRLLLSTDMIVTAIGQSTTTMITSGSKSVAAGITHKYGEHAGEAAESVGRTVQNCSVIYIDAQGVGRRALLKRVGKGVFQARLGKKDVVLGEDTPTNAPATSSSTNLATKPAPPALPPRSLRPSPSPGASPAPTPMRVPSAGAILSPPPYTPYVPRSQAQGRTRPSPPPLPPRDISKLNGTS